ncbi:hypothetical protein F4809DRAFT_659161 [Biscogniauxia mediterranea]|nr:hypothetical protein F4809DRAFT_659161 [Biscogniauxia mediterranea]
MPDEEMEITTDLGQPGFGEDIDIDLDFVAGQADEDMELGDFDQAQDMENFNSDTRDELMAEGDDASYGMIDADDVDRNEAATAANDIEIDIGDPDENLWQQDIPQDEDIGNAAEIDYIEDVVVENSVPDQPTTAPDDNTWLEAPADIAIQPLDLAEIETSNVEVEVTVITSEDQPLDNAGSNVGVEFRDFGASQDADEISKPSDARHPQNDAPSDSLDQEIPGELRDVNTQASSDEPSGADHLDVNNDEVNSNQDTIPNGTITKPGNESDVQDTNGHIAVAEAEDEQHNDDATGDEHEPNGTVPIENAVESEEAVQQEYDEQEQAHDSSESNPPENQLDGESSIDITNKQASPGQESPQAQPTSGTFDTTDQQIETSHEESETREAEGLATTGDEDEKHHLTDNSRIESPASVAARYGMYISYGQTDYRLFAKSEDDDPNQFFLNGMSALDLPLARFLASLRDVISEEISPLDELVLHVDGLGLEFSESSTVDFLETYTFGDILCLYDKLVKNDAVESSPDLYTYLMVRPNCSQRLMALMDSANAGRGLSEIAVYRDSTPFEDEHISATGSQVPEMSPDDEGDEEEYRSQEDDYEDSGEFDNTAEAGDNDTGTNPPEADASTVEVTTEDVFVGQTESPVENASNGADAGTADELIDYSDEEPDVSSVQQDNSAYPSPQDHVDDAQEEHYDLEATETGDLNQHSSPTTVINTLVDAPNSDHTSATATLNGDEQDEIDYSDEDEAEDGTNDKITPRQSPDPGATQEVPIDDEITWESENEDARNETKAAPKETVQVSPAPGKRARSDSDNLDSTSEENDVKRRRS